VAARCCGYFPGYPAVRYAALTYNNFVDVVRPQITNEARQYSAVQLQEAYNLYRECYDKQEDMAKTGIFEDIVTGATNHLPNLRSITIGNRLGCSPGVDAMGKRIICEPCYLPSDEDPARAMKVMLAGIWKSRTNLTSLELLHGFSQDATHTLGNPGQISWPFQGCFAALRRLHFKIASRGQGQSVSQQGTLALIFQSAPLLED